MWLALRGTDYGAVTSSIREARPAWLVLAMVGFAGTFLAFAARWRWLLRPFGEFRFGEVLVMTVAGAALSNVVPGRPGEALRAYWAGRAKGISSATCFGTVVVDRMSDVLCLVALLLVAFPFVAHPAWLDGLMVGGIGLALVALVVLIASWWRTHSAGRGPAASNQASPSSRTRRHLRAFARGLAPVTTRRDLAAVSMFALLAWVSWGIGAWACAKAIGPSLSLVDVIFLTAIVNLGLAVPSSPGFVGTLQWLVVTALSTVSIGRSEAFAVSVLLHVMAVVPVTLVGLLVATRFAGGLSGAIRGLGRPAGLPPVESA